MSARKGTRKKATKRHHTAIGAVETLLGCLNKRPEVTKISLGFITSGLSTAPTRVKVRRLNDAVLAVKVRGTRAVQEVKVYTTDATVTSAAILVFVDEKRGWKITA